jgi:hypothetical protein
MDLRSSQRQFLKRLGGLALYAAVVLVLYAALVAAIAFVVFHNPSNVAASEHERLAHEVAGPRAAHVKLLVERLRVQKIESCSA